MFFFLLDPRIQKLRHENDKTEMKLAYLRHVMEEKRKLRLQRKHAAGNERKSGSGDVEMPQEKIRMSEGSALERMRRASLEVRTS